MSHSVISDQITLENTIVMSKEEVCQKSLKNALTIQNDIKVIDTSENDIEDFALKF